MSHIVVVGGSTGIGRDVQPYLHTYRHTTTTLPRAMKAPIGHVGGLLLCQRWRPEPKVGYGDAGKTYVPELDQCPDWWGELIVSMDRSRQMCEWAGEHMNGGSIVVMASVAGVSVEEEQPVSYHAAKAALIEMVKYYAVTLGPKQIRVNAIIPGLTVKPEARPFYDAHPELEATYQDITPLGRMCTVGDLAFEINHLINPKGYVTGQTIVVDGGISLRSHWALARRVAPSLRGLHVTQRKRAQ